MSLNKAPENNVFYRNQNWYYPKIVYGKGVYLYGEDGKKYMDACSGSAVANIGHGNEEVAEATAEQIKKIAFTHLSRFTNDAIEDCAETVANWTPGDLNHVYFVSGGSEATETAIKLSRQYFVERDGKGTSKWKVISRWNSFHGNTMGSLSMTGSTGRRRIYDPLLINFPKIHQAYCYRCPYESSYPECNLQCAYELEETILRWGPESIAAFIAEPVIGSAAPGVNPPKEYFKVIREICNKYDVIMILDEVMAGCGRTGKNFGIDHYDVVPDIITMAKGMSSGYTPIGAAVTNNEIFETIMVKGSGQFIHGHTYGGNPLSASISQTVMKIIEREGYIENARVQGEYLFEQMEELYKYPIVGEIRGKGLMIGIEFVKDQETKKPFDTDKNVKGIFTKHCLNEGIVPYPGGGSVDGIKGDHTLFAPPININREEIEEFYEKLENAIENTSKEVLGAKNVL
ncbi:aspartate aminotransferase family protein [Anaerosalibacter massiliensis]|uniref:aspartate aminotransferase family protein n=1 Tax=Anaerosalibacter massiliensis TaxID=1347392 RepID=UPI0005B2D80E|nr:aspartate aminotransferase family protein [Anaerosalibacter massiliensis]